MASTVARRRTPPAVYNPSPVVYVNPAPAPAFAPAPPVIVMPSRPVVQPLGALQVYLPFDQIEQRGSVTFFAIDVFPADGSRPWRVMRRYNQLNDLSSRLGGHNEYPRRPEFPRKHLLGCTGEKLEQRRFALEVWLQWAVQHPNSQGSWGQELRRFLEVDAYAQRATSSSPSPVAPPLEPPSAPPSQTVTTPPAPPSHTVTRGEDTVLQIDVPHDTRAGQQIAVTVPDGRQVLLTLPDGASPGMPLELWYDATAGTLSVLP